MMDRHLAEMYGVETKVLNQAVKRNLSRFPADFMFQLTLYEYQTLRSQFVTLESGKGKHSKYSPYVFTEQGVAMLSSVLHSETAIQVNIHIIRIFTRMREILEAQQDVLAKMVSLERTLIKQGRRVDKHEEKIENVLNALRKLLSPPSTPRKRIGYKPDGP